MSHENVRKLRTRATLTVQIAEALELGLCFGVGAGEQGADDRLVHGAWLAISGDPELPVSVIGDGEAAGPDPAVPRPRATAPAAW